MQGRRVHDAELSAAIAAEHNLRIEDSMRRMDRFVRKMRAVSQHSRIADFFEHAGRKLFEDRDDGFFLTLLQLRTVPVSIDEFLESSDFVGGLDMEVWPQIRKDVRLVCPDIWAGAPRVAEYIDSGATGTGKTMKAHLVQAYHLYLTQCLKKPQRFYQQAESTPIVFTMASSNVSTTRDVLFRPFRDMVANMKFFRKHTSWNRDKTSVLEFSNGIRVEPVSATNQGIIGRAVLCAHVDEANYMQVVERSAKAEHQSGKGRYDQAELFYKQVRLRRQGRFPSRLPLPGLIILSSSIRHDADFLERRIEQVNSTVSVDDQTGETVRGEPGVEIFRHKQYDVQPAERFSTETFRLLVGTPEYPTRILEDHEQAGTDFPEDGRVELVPVDYRYEFMHRPEDALRDVCGISSVALSPFIMQRQKIGEAMDRWMERGNEHPVLRDNVDLVDHGMPVLVPDKLDADQETVRFAHIDLSKTGDRCGIAVVRVDEMIELEVQTGLWQMQPYLTVELAVSIQPSQAKELDIAAVRNWVVALQTEHSVPLYRITYDGFNSAESIQAVRALGIRSKVISMDRTDEPYEMMKRALYQDRLDLPPNPILKQELTQLDKDETTGKIDHPKTGSKDISDAVAGAVFSAVTSRVYRNQIYYTDGNGNRVAATRQRVRSNRRRRQKTVDDD